MKLADRIIFHLLQHGRKDPSEIMIPNFHCFMYEMDVFKLMKTGLVVEYEVKISRADFFNDFKKNHGRYLQDPVYKHQELAQGRAANRFFFVVPKGLVSKEEVPYYAGLMYFNQTTDEVLYGRDYIHTEKPAPLIHKRQFEDYKWLATSLSWREERWRRKVQKV